MSFGSRCLRVCLCVCVRVFTYLSQTLSRLRASPSATAAATIIGHRTRSSGLALFAASLPVSGSSSLLYDDDYYWDDSNNNDYSGNCLLVPFQMNENWCHRRRSPSPGCAFNPSFLLSLPQRARQGRRLEAAGGGRGINAN